MRRIKLILAVGAVMVMVLALSAGPALANDFDIDVDGNDIGDLNSLGFLTLDDNDLEDILDDDNDLDDLLDDDDKGDVDVFVGFVPFERPNGHIGKEFVVDVDTD